MSAPNYSRLVPFDKKKIREKINNIDYNAARRLKGPIYDTLIQELQEQGCKIAARHFHCLVLNEQRLAHVNLIRMPLSRAPKLLNQLFDNVKLAEQSAQLADCSGIAATFKLLLQCLELLEAHGSTFDWLLSDLYAIFTRICDNVSEPSDSTMETIAHIYYKCGVYLISKYDEADNVVLYLGKALSLARSHTWPSPNRNEYDNLPAHETLHQSVVITLCNFLLSYSQKLVNSNISKALALIQEAILTIAEVNCKESEALSCRAQLTQARLLITAEEYSKALKILEHVHLEILQNAAWEFAVFNCELVLYRGICLNGLGNSARAHNVLRQALQLSRKMHLKEFEASSCLHLGILYAYHNNERSTAKEYLRLARKLYTELGMMDDTMKVTYQLAKLQVNQLFPLFMDMLKSQGERYCCFYNMRRWKNLCQPFWPTLRTDLDEEQPTNNVYCLMRGYSEECLRGVMARLVKAPSKSKALHKNRSKSHMGKLKASDSKARSGPFAKL